MLDLLLVFVNILNYILFLYFHFNVIQNFSNLVVFLFKKKNVLNV